MWTKIDINDINTNKHYCLAVLNTENRTVDRISHYTGSDGTVKWFNIDKSETYEFPSDFATKRINISPQLKALINNIQQYLLHSAYISDEFNDIVVEIEKIFEIKELNPKYQLFGYVIDLDFNIDEMMKL